MMELLESFSLAGVIISLVINLLLGSTVMWLAIKLMVDIPGGVRFKQCAMCVLFLNIMTAVSLALLLLPLGLMTLIIWMAAWYYAAKAIVEGVFELISGSTMILVLYFLVTVLVNTAIKGILAA